MKKSVGNMNLVIDVGNTNTVFGIFDNDVLLHSFRLESDADKFKRDYFDEIFHCLNKTTINTNNIENIALSSVIPKLTEVFTGLSSRISRCNFINVTPFTKLGLEFPVEDPGFIGSDLIVNAFAAKEIYKTNCIICDFGTATTFQLVGKNGYFYGTIIAPGIKTAAGSLFKNAALLSEVEPEQPKQILGTSTKDAILSGIVTGNALMTDGFIQRIKAEYQNIGNIQTIATGGISELIAANSKEIDVVDRDLTLKGLNGICKII
jgi:type III pantothenate kinase